MRLMFSLIFLVLSVVLSAGNNSKVWRSNGVEVWFIADNNLPMLDLSLVFDAGSIREGKNQGLAKLTNSMIFTGCGNNLESDVAKLFEASGASNSADSEYDFAKVSLRVLTERQYLEPALAAYTQCLSEPRFSMKSLSKVRSILAAKWRENQKDPIYLAMGHLKKQFYPNHAYGRFTNVAPKKMSEIKLESINSFYRAHYNSANARLILVGDLSDQQAHKIADKITASLLKGDPLPKLPKVKPGLLKSANIYLPNQVQDTFVLALPGLAISANGSLALDIANQPLASGALSSRLMQQLREKYGFTYSISGLMRQRKLAGEYYILFKSRPKVSDKALSVAQQTIENYLHTGASAKEFEFAKKAMINEYKYSSSSNYGLMQDLVATAGVSLGLDWYQSYPERVNKISLEKINKVFAGMYAKVKPVIVRVINAK